ncbi:MAG: hypothetical protein ACI94Y_003765 [Maribacter sp.]|jgi:hypothetical protein
MKNTKYILATILLFIIAIILPFDVEAQCAMCKATAEQSDQVGLNMGILYLFLMPYTIVATIAFFWWRNRKKESEISNFDPKMN